MLSIGVGPRNVCMHRLCAERRGRAVNSRKEGSQCLRALYIHTYDIHPISSVPDRGDSFRRQR
jgi:hypothetical protein